ncbi:MAG TPA: hypothetical protein GXX15_06855 [Clostridia bacterium]|nr:hypothetical protein [Clostridia bacterium]
MKIFAGYDCGGSKTKCILADENGEILASAVEGPSNFLSCGYEIAKKSIEECTRQALLKAGFKENKKIYSAYVGSASVELFSKNERIYNFYKSSINTEYLGINNDAYIAWYGTTFGKTGIISISGTGAVTYGICEDGRWKKAGGWGYLVEDEGSGYSLGRKALQLAVKSYDGIIDKNKFEKEIMEFFSLKSMKELTPMLYQDPYNGVRIVASAAKCLFKLFNEDYSLAMEILEEATSQIADTIYAVYSYLDLKNQFIRIGVAGGIFYAGGNRLLEMLDKKLRERGMEMFHLTFPEILPEVSALLLAYNQLRCEDYKKAEQTIMQQFKKSIEVKQNCV